MRQDKKTTWTLGTVWLAAAGLLAVTGSLANADFVFGDATNVGPAINSSANEFGPYRSGDGLELYFARGDARSDIWIAHRATLDSEWEPASSIGPPINLADNGTVFLTPDGLTLYLDGNRPGTYGTYDLWVTTRATTADNWATPVNLGAMVNSSSEDWGPSLSADGLELYFTSNRPGGQGNFDLWMATRATVDDDWSAPVNLGPPFNTSAIDAFPSISADGRVLFFASTRPGGSGQMELYMAKRATTKDPWGPATNLGPKVNSAYIDNGVRVSADGSMLYFFSFRSGGFGAGDIWQAPIIRIVDFNGDGTVDGKEVLEMAECWGETDPALDIGPTPLGDGIVDINDLATLAGYIGAEIDDPTLLAHWALDETDGLIASDSAGDHDGTVMGVPAWQPAGGAVEGALEFDGTTFVVADHVLNPADSAFSVLAWIKGGAPGQGIIAQQDGVNWLMANALDGTLMTELSRGGRHASVLYSESMITDGDWHRVGFTWDGSTCSLYVDAVLVAQDTQSGLAGCYGGLNIGCGTDMAPGTFWGGLIDDVRIYSRAVRP